MSDDRYIALRLYINNGYFYVLFHLRAHSPFIEEKKWCEHRIRKNQQIKGTVHDAR